MSRYTRLALANLLVLFFILLLVEIVSFSLFRLRTGSSTIDLSSNVSFVADPLASNRRRLDKYQEHVRKGDRVFLMQTVTDINPVDINSFKDCDDPIGSKTYFLQNPGNSTIVSGEESDGVLVFQTDKFGFRNSPSQVYDSDILIVGDSFTEGADVPDEWTISSLLTQLGKPTYNGGKSGTGIGHFSEVAKEMAPKVRPEVIVVNIHAGTSIRRFLNRRNPVLLQVQNDCNFKFSSSVDPNYPDDDWILRSQVANSVASKFELWEEFTTFQTNTVTVVNFLRPIKNIIKLSNTYRLVKHLKPYEYLGEGFPQCDNIIRNRQNLDKVITKFSETAQRSNAAVVFNYLPDSWYYTSDYSLSYRNKLHEAIACEQSILEESIAQNMKANYIFLDNLDIFYTNNLDDSKILRLYFADNHHITRGYETVWRGHYSKQGYKIVAEHLFEKITAYLSPSG